MSTVCNLETIPAKATISAGGTTVTTPHIINITISRVRGQLVGTASMQYYSNSGVGGAGAGAGLTIEINGGLAFTGSIRRIDTSPSYRCAGEIIVRIQAEDYLHRLVNKNITRRQKNSGLGPICFISSIYKRVTVGFDAIRDRHDISSTSSPVDVFTPTMNFADMLQFIRSGDNNTLGGLHPITKNGDWFDNNKASGGGGGMILHDHSSLNLGGPHAGGPSKAVF